MLAALRRHWPEYLIEAWALGSFMIVAGVVATALEATASPVRAAIESDLARRALMGLAMGVTAVALIRSSWGRRSGAHMNPAVTLAFLRLGKVAPADAAWYVLFQVAGGAAGAAIVALLLGDAFIAPPVQAIATLPGALGLGGAFVAEFLMVLTLFTTVLATSNSGRCARCTPFVVGAFVFAFITLEAPISGMSLNPARSLASAIACNEYGALWIYIAAPTLGALAAAELWRLLGRESVCAKLDHTGRQRCIFRCGYCRHSAVADTPNARVASEAA